MRQFFELAVRDQIAWIAVANVIGPSLDGLMPPWVYGYRLYRTSPRRKYVQNSSAAPSLYTDWQGELYRSFEDSWPLYRRHIEAAARCARTNRNDSPIDTSRPSHYVHPAYLPKYLKASFWRTRPLSYQSPYLCSLDFKHFYPSIRSENIKKNLFKYYAPYRKELPFRILVDRLLSFVIDASSVSATIQAASEPPCDAGEFDGVPTGLWIAGFLANVALLDVDLEIDSQPSVNHVAHFRFIDDHTFLARNPSDLWQWITWYRELLLEHGLAIEINVDKTVPAKLGEALAENAVLPTEIGLELSSSLSEVATKTLTEISTISREDFSVLTAEDQESRLEQLRALLLDDLPKAEIDTGTRRSFAASRIATLAPWLSRQIAPTHKHQEDSTLLYRQMAALRRQLRVTEEQTNHASVLKRRLDALQVRFDRVLRSEQITVERRNTSEFKRLWAVFRREPEKPALLEALFTFCRSSGHSGVKFIMQELSAATSSPQTLYLHALGVQVLSKSILRSLRVVGDETALRSRQESSLDHLRDVARLLPKELIRPDPEVFHLKALKLLRIALASAAEVLAKRNREDDSLRAIRRVCLRLGTELWTAPSSDRDLSERRAVRAFWVEQEVRPASSESPSPVWLRVASRLDPANDIDWHLLQLYPDTQPNLIKLLKARGLKWRKEDGGWLWDAISAAHLRRTQLLRFANGSPVLSELAHLNSTPEDRDGQSSVHLSSWLAAVSAATEKSPFDPRASEWTALEIFKRIVEQVRNDRVPPQHLVPLNITVSGALFDVQSTRGSGQLTWENWRSIARSDLSVGILPHDLSDYRAISRSSLEANRPAEVFPALGLLLLTLLQARPTYPVSWNLEGQRDVRLGSVFQYVRQLSISSTTASILDFCLAPRHLERRMRSTPTLGSAKRRSAIVRELNLIIVRSANAQRVLEEFQIGILGYEPSRLRKNECFSVDYIVG